MKVKYRNPRDFVVFYIETYDESELKYVAKSDWEAGIKLIHVLGVRNMYSANLVWNLTDKTRIKDRYTNTNIPLTDAEIIEKVKNCTYNQL